MWIFDFTLVEIALRTLVIYIVVLIGIRVFGKREVGQMTPFDLVLLLLIANAVQNAMTGPDSTVTGGIVAAVTLLMANALVTRLVFRHKKFRRWVEGSPTLLIHSGAIIQQNVTKERISPDELHQVLREHGIVNVEDVHIAVLEVDGRISVLRKDELPKVSQPHHWIHFIRNKGE